MSHKDFNERCRVNRQPHFTTDSTPNTAPKGHTITQECIPVGCVPSAAVAVWEGGFLLRGLSAWGCLLRGVCLGDVCPEGEFLFGGGVCLGVSAQGRGGICLGDAHAPGHRGRHLPPPDPEADIPTVPNDN